MERGGARTLDEGHSRGGVQAVQQVPGGGSRGDHVRPSVAPVGQPWSSSGTVHYDFPPPSTSATPSSCERRSRSWREERQSRGNPLPALHVERLRDDERALLAPRLDHLVTQANADRIGRKVLPGSTIPDSDVHAVMAMHQRPSSRSCPERARPDALGGSRAGSPSGRIRRGASGLICAHYRAPVRRRRGAAASGATPDHAVRRSAELAADLASWVSEPCGRSRRPSWP